MAPAIFIKGVDYAAWKAYKQKLVEHQQRQMEPVGFEVSVLGRQSGKVESAGRYFLAPTAEANHLIAIKKRGDGSTCTHQSLTFAGTVAELEGLLQEHLNGASGESTAAAKKGGN